MATGYNSRTIATYNEADSIGSLIETIHTAIPHAHILVIDDNSPDGTAQIVATEADKNERVHLLLRTDRRGLGTATLEGIQWAQKRAAEVVVHLDGDFSHNPADIPRLIAASNFQMMCQSILLLGHGRYLVELSLVGR